MPKGSWLKKSHFDGRASIYLCPQAAVLLCVNLYTERCYLCGEQPNDHTQCTLTLQLSSQAANIDRKTVTSLCFNKSSCHVCVPLALQEANKLQIWEGSALVGLWPSVEHTGNKWWCRKNNFFFLCVCVRVCVCVQRGYTETGRSLEMCGYIVINVYLSMVVVSVC